MPYAICRLFYILFLLLAVNHTHSHHMQLQGMSYVCSGVDSAARCTKHPLARKLYVVLSLQAEVCLTQEGVEEG